MNPATRVDDLALFPNGSVQRLSKAQVAALDRGEEVIVATPERREWRAVEYGSSPTTFLRSAPRAPRPMNRRPW